MPYHHMGSFGFFPFGLLGGFIWLLVFVGLGLLAFWAIRSLAGPHGGRWTPAQAIPPPPSAPSPYDILARRFAAGEISADEYQKAREVLAGPAKS